MELEGVDPGRDDRQLLLVDLGDQVVMRADILAQGKQSFFEERDARDRSQVSDVLWDGVEVEPKQVVDGSWLGTHLQPGFKLITALKGEGEEYFVPPVGD